MKGSRSPISMTYCRILFLWLVFLSIPLVAQSQTFEEELKTFSSFREINLKKLIDGDILVEKAEVKGLHRGIGSEALFVVKIPAARAAELFADWEASHRPLQKPYIHQNLKEPVTIEQFGRLELASKEGPIRWLVDKTRNVQEGRNTPLMLSEEEKKLASSLVQSSPETSRIEDFWRQSLFSRADKFINQGISSQEPVDGNQILAEDELKELLLSIPLVKSQFNELFERAIFRKGSVPGSLKTNHYWELLETNNHGVLYLASIFTDPSDSKNRSIECSYYASSDTYVAFTLRQVWPISHEGNEYALVWRGEFASTPHLEEAKAVERVAARSMMAKDLKKEIEEFQRDAVKQ